jgi:hypothetical protein
MPQPEAAAARGFPLPGGGRLELGEVIGRGSSGVVHRAVLRQADGSARPAAAKLLGPGATARQQEAFLAEIKKTVAVGARCSGVVVPIGAMQLDGQVPTRSTVRCVMMFDGGVRVTARASARQVCLLMELYEGSLAGKLDVAGGALPLELALGYGERRTGAARPFWTAIDHRESPLTIERVWA